MQLSGKKKYVEYLILAVTEIFLVVIGILLAIQFENWKDQKKRKEKAINYLHSIKSDLRTDSTNLKQALVFVEKMISNKEILLQRTQYNGIELDSLIKLVKPNYKRKSINNQTFLKFRNSELIELKNFEEISLKINSYYTSKKQAYGEFIDWDVDYTLKESEFWYYNKEFEITYNSKPYPYLNSPEKQRENLINHISSIEGRNRIRGSLYRKKNVKIAIDEMYNSCEKLLSEISLHLAKSN